MRLKCGNFSALCGGYHSHKSDVFAEFCQVPNCRGKLAGLVPQTIDLELNWYKNQQILLKKFDKAGKKSCNLD